MQSAIEAEYTQSNSFIVNVSNRQRRGAPTTRKTHTRRYAANCGIKCAFSGANP